jgi:solute carrier family 13 (sodium-dependent dicarboxylate transporter), member 2/3/5
MLNRDQLAAASEPVRVVWLGRIGGPLMAIAVYSLLATAEVPPAVDLSRPPAEHTAATGERLSHEARATAAIATLMAIWWMTESLPLPVTSLIPIALFPLAGVMPVGSATAPYADKNIFLFMGGFLIALAVQRWNLHRRLALLTVLGVGTSPHLLVGGIMLATAGLSMWISNTAATAMMLPIGMSLVTLLVDKMRGGAGDPDAAAFATCLMLGIAYSASIGGVATLIGTPTNLFFAGFAHEHGIAITFAGWMALGVPVAAVLLLVCWVVLTRLVFPIGLRDIPGGRELIRGEWRRLGRITRGEYIVLCVCAAVASAWVAREPLSHWQWLTDQLPVITRLDDTVIAMAGALLLFVIPVDIRRGVFALDWETASQLPWGVLLLFGGGFSLAAAISGSGLADWMGSQVAFLEGLPPLALMLAVVTMIVFLTELTSNTATAAAFLPILYAVAVGIQVDPILLMVPAAIAASCAFMLPVATPPNAIVFGSGCVTIGDMVRAGLRLNLIAIVLIPLLVYWLGALVLGIKL